MWTKILPLAVPLTCKSILARTVSMFTVANPLDSPASGLYTASTGLLGQKCKSVRTNRPARRYLFEEETSWRQFRLWK